MLGPCEENRGQFGAMLGLSRENPATRKKAKTDPKAAYAYPAVDKKKSFEMPSASTLRQTSLASSAFTAKPSNDSTNLQKSASGIFSPYLEPPWKLHCPIVWKTKTEPMGSYKETLEKLAMGSKGVWSPFLATIEKR